MITISPQAEDFCDRFFQFLRKSVSMYHAVEAMANRLSNRGFSRLFEWQTWNLKMGESYFLVREDSSIIAFTLGTEGLDKGFRMLAAHTDSPSLQIKPQPVLKSGENQLVRLGVEVYGGPLLQTWFDRDLSIAGRLCIKQKDQSMIETLLIDFDRPVLTLPNIAIHLNRSANDGQEINKQTQLPPILMQDDVDFHDILRTRLNELYGKSHQDCDILSYDLFCRDIQPPIRTGLNGEFISAGKLDNLLSCFTAMEGLIEGTAEHNSLLFCSNHEENGSLSSSGAQGNFLLNTLQRIYNNHVNLAVGLANSFLISMDNAHATHPNYPDKMDSSHEIFLNKGPVIKYNANQRYSTSAPTAAIFMALCRDAGITPQNFVMRNDMPCGSTIGPMTAAKLGLRSVDIGAASLAMHSIREMTGVLDPWLCFCAVKQFIRGNYHLQNNNCTDT